MVESAKDRAKRHDQIGWTVLTFWPLTAVLIAIGRLVLIAGREGYVSVAAVAFHAALLAMAVLWIRRQWRDRPSS